MATEKYVQAAIPQFDGHYDHWAMRMENLLRSKEYWDLIEIGVPLDAEDGVVSTEAHKQLKLKDLKVKNYLFQAIDRTIMETILDKSSAKSIWDSMRQKHQGSTRVKRAQLQALRREFEVLQMKEGEKVDEYFGRTLTIVNKMTVHGETMKQIVVIEKILRSLTSRFDYVVCSVEESNDLSQLTIDELQSSLLVHEQRMHRHHQHDEQLFNVSYEGGGRSRGGQGIFRDRGRGRSSGAGRGRYGFNKALVECYKCHKLGHFQYECPSWEKGAHYAEIHDDEELLLMVQTEFDTKDDADGDHYAEDDELVLMAQPKFNTELVVEEDQYDENHENEESLLMIHTGYNPAMYTGDKFMFMAHTEFPSLKEKM